MDTMNLVLSRDEFILFRDLIEKECGIALQEDKMYLVESRLMSLVVENGCKSFGDFYLKVKTEPGFTLKEKIVDAMTTNETLWFRDASPFMVFRDRLMPEFVDQIKNGQKRQIRIWSAACSTGQEPYSLAMFAHEFARTTGRKELLNGGLYILATDISSAVLLLAKNARYNPLAMSRGMLPGFKENYFEQQGSLWFLKDDIKNMIKFQQFNLQKPFDSLGTFDMILLRNVAIYFSPECKVELFRKVEKALTPGGYFFLGNSETLIGYNTNFQLQERNNCMFYKLKGPLNNVHDER